MSQGFPSRHTHTHTHTHEEVVDLAFPSRRRSGNLGCGGFTRARLQVLGLVPGTNVHSPQALRPESGASFQAAATTAAFGSGEKRSRRAGQEESNKLVLTPNVSSSSTEKLPASVTGPLEVGKPPPTLLPPPGRMEEQRPGFQGNAIQPEQPDQLSQEPGKNHLKERPPDPSRGAQVPPPVARPDWEQRPSRTDGPTTQFGTGWRVCANTRKSACF